MSPRFVHLHLHSEYSLSDSTIRLSKLVARCVELGLPAVAVTDQGNLFALVKFWRDAARAGVKPITGSDVFVESGSASPDRMTLLCQSHRGYLSLSRLLSRGFLDGHHGDHVAIEMDWLLGDAEDLIVLAGRHSAIGRLALDSKLDAAQALLRQWQLTFGDRLYLELTRTGRAGEEEFIAAALQLAAACDCPLVASNDVRFVAREDFDAHEARVCIASGRVLADPRRPRDYSPEQWLKPAEDMVELFADLPEALLNSVEIARRCNVELNLGTYFLPDFPVPDGHSLDSWIRHEAAAGLERRLAQNPLAPGHPRESYEARLRREIDVIVSMGFPGYFLIVADFINWAKDHGIPVGPGRGSGAGSLVAWALGITDLDPLRYDLLFERFLNPERVSMPDFDIDFCMDRRDEVIDYVGIRYGRDRVSQIITYGTMAAKAAVRDCGRVLSLPYGLVDGVAKLIPNVLGICLDDALGRSEKSRGNADMVSAELVQRYEHDDEVRDLIDLALKLEDLTRNAGKHAGGVVIAPQPLTAFSPLFAEPPTRDGSTRSVVTQFDKDDVEAIGLVKFDFLGLRTLTIIDWAVKAINRRRERSGEAPLDIARLPLDDIETYRLFARGDTVAVFQFESRGMRDMLKKALPDCFEDLIALVSLYRPGPMDLIPDYIERKHGRQVVDYAEPRLQSILGPTYGVMVYQEQVMQIAQTLGGYSLGGADLLRRAMGKKKQEEMDKQAAIFIAGAAENGIAEATARAIFDQMAKFAGYGFNKSHAAAYSLVAFQTAWLKVHYPAEFMAAVLSADMDNTDKVVNFLAEARQLGLALDLPDVNSSGFQFEATEPRRLRYGLGAIKGLGQNVCEAMVAARAQAGPFGDVFDLCNRVEPLRRNRRSLEVLIQSGAMDVLGPNRATMLAQLGDVLKGAEQLAREREVGQSSLFGGPAEHSQPMLPDLPVLPEMPFEQRLEFERATLGHYVSGHPLDPQRPLLGQIVHGNLGELEKLYTERKFSRGTDAQVLLAGMIVDVRRQGDSRAFVRLDDGHGQVELVLFSDACLQFGALLTARNVVVAEGALQEDRGGDGFAMKPRRLWSFAELCAIQARRLLLRADNRRHDTLARVEQLLASHRPGETPVQIDLLLPDAAGSLFCNGTYGVRADPQLTTALAAIDGVSEIELRLARPEPAPWEPRRGAGGG